MLFENQAVLKHISFDMLPISYESRDIYLPGPGTASGSSMSQTIDLEIILQVEILSDGVAVDSHIYDDPLCACYLRLCQRLPISVKIKWQLSSCHKISPIQRSFRRPCCCMISLLHSTQSLSALVIPRGLTIRGMTRAERDWVESTSSCQAGASRGRKK